MSTIIEKVKKLLALAESSNIHEASAAAAQAQRLITQHKLELAELSASVGSDANEPVDDVEAFSTRSYIPWKMMLFSGLAHVNGCKTYHQRWTNAGQQESVMMRVIGTSTSTSTVKYMFAYLVREIDRLAALRREMGRSWLRDFRIGATTEVVGRLREAMKIVVQESNTSSTALAIIDKERDEVERVFSALALKSGPGVTVRSTNAMNEGRRAGSKINLETGRALGKGDAGQLK